MKIINVMVMSVDGKTTKADNSNISGWTSPDDKAYFSKLTSNASCLIMGRKTYEAASKTMQLSPATLRIVMTHDREQYTSRSVPDQLEFTNDSPRALCAKLAKRGYKEAYLLGGERLNAEFLKDKLIDELWLTLEPCMLGVGNGLSGQGELDQQLSLISSQQLNEKGTLLLKYQFIK